MLFEGRFFSARVHRPPCSRSDEAVVGAKRRGFSKGVRRLEHPWTGARGRDPAERNENVQFPVVLFSCLQTTFVKFIESGGAPPEPRQEGALQLAPS